MNNFNSFSGVVCRFLFTALFFVIFIDEALTQRMPGAQVCPMEWKPYYTSQNQLTCTWSSKNKASWIDSLNWCKAMDSQLVEIKTAQFNLHVMRNLPPGQTGKYWIGSTDMEMEMNYKWMTSGTATSLRLFDPSQIRSTTAKNCVSTDEKAYWSVEDCKAEFWFICQKIPKASPSTAQNAQNAQGAQGAQGAQAFNMPQNLQGAQAFNLPPSTQGAQAFNLPQTSGPNASQMDLSRLFSRLVQNSGI